MALVLIRVRNQHPRERYRTGLSREQMRLWCAGYPKRRTAMSGLGPEAMGTAAKVWHRCRCAKTDGGAPMTQVDDLSRSLIAFEQKSTMVVVLEMSQSSWLAAGVVPGFERRPLKKLDPDPTALLRLVEGWRDHAMKVGRMITRIVLAFEAGRDGFWLARWLRARSIDPFVIHSTSVAVSREHRRAKTDRLDTEMLIRVFLGWLLVSLVTAKWSRSQRLRKKTPGAQAASAKA